MELHQVLQSGLMIKLDHSRICFLCWIHETKFMEALGFGSKKNCNKKNHTNLHTFERTVESLLLGANLQLQSLGFL